MQSSRNREIVELNLLENHEFLDEIDVWQIVIHPMNDNYGTRSCKDPEFWHARQTFLSSYHFSDEGEDYNTRYKLKRSVKKISGVVMEVVLGYYRRKVTQMRKLRIKTYRASLARSSILLRCFIPWWSNKE